MTVSKTFWLPMTTEPYPRIISLIPSPTMLQSMKELRVQIYEHLLLPNTGIETGSTKDNSKIDEINIKNPTKRLGEVDNTGAESFILQHILQRITYP